MKKFLKIAGSICLGVLIWVVVIAGVVFLFSKQAKKNIAEMTKDMEINTTDTKDTDKDEPEITVNITKTPSSGKQDISDDDYYDTMQEALLNATINLELEEQYRRNIDEVIREFESDEYTLIFYRSVKNKQEQSFSYARFKILYENEEKKYHFNKMKGTIETYHARFTGNARDVIRNYLIDSDILGSIGVNPDKERFIYGEVREDFFEDGENIDALEIEGQKPDEIIEYESFGKKWYFWYYNDLQSDKASSELKVTLK